MTIEKPFLATDLVSDAALLLARLRAERPLVQALTNYVSMDVAANTLLAIGASPAMVHAPEESADFAAFAGAVVINIGTLSKSFVVAMLTAAEAADRLGRPWTLDPVGAGATGFRDRTVAELLRHRPTIIRGNASEILAVARIAGLHEDAAAPKGVDSAHETAAARVLAIGLARQQRCVVAATGAVDIVTDGERVVELSNGSPLMAKVTALGCSLSAIVAAFSALTPNVFLATSAAVAIYGVAGEMAAEKAQHPGSFRVAFLDALDEISEGDIVQRLRAS